jgi:hypothetical protein
MAYKGFDKNFKCRGFQYEVGKTYIHEGEITLCKAGFHYCEDPLDIFKHYSPQWGARYCLVTPGGTIKHDLVNNKSVASKITIEQEVSLYMMVKSVLKDVPEEFPKKWITKVGREKQLANASNSYQVSVQPYTTQIIDGNNNTQVALDGGDYQIALGDCNLQIGSTYCAQIAKGVQTIQYAIGHEVTQTSDGDESIQIQGGHDISQVITKQISNGNDSIQLASSNTCFQECNGEGSLSMNAGNNGRVKLGKNGTAVLRWTDENNRARIRVLYEGEKGIKAGVWYELNNKGRVQKVKEEIE